jgi:hypothetical protein
MSRYENLVAILDGLCNEAIKPYPKTFKWETPDQVQASRCRAYIHLLLKVRFGLLDLKNREYHVTDGSHDGGIDAYYIDNTERIIYLIQSKFRINNTNFECKEISYDELLSMDIERIIQGCEENEDGVRYNARIIKLQEDIHKISDITEYKFKIIIQANLLSVNDTKIKKLIGDFPYEIYDSERVYNELVFPMVSGTYYKQDRLTIILALNSDTGDNRINYQSSTENGDCTVNIMFAPTREIGRILYQYRNTILQYNPRSYLGLEKNPINANIKKSIEIHKTNEFALLNNGITMLADYAKYSARVGKSGEAQLSLINPQIINGGQTAYTLSKIYEKAIEKNDLSIFNPKEVLLRVISFNKSQSSPASEEDRNKRIQLIEEISTATNQQTEVTEADRRANSQVLVGLQQLIFKDFGLYFERKQGEFSDGLIKRYIEKEQVIDKESFIRCCIAVSGRPSRARQKSIKILFRKDVFDSILPNTEDYKHLMFAYLVSNQLTTNILETKGIKLYARYAIVYVASTYYQNDISIDDFGEKIDAILEDLFTQWDGFETYVQSLDENRRRYFKEKRDEATNEIRVNANWQGYYKGVTLNSDLRAYFVDKREE